MNSICPKSARNPIIRITTGGYVRLIHPVPVLFVMLGTALFGLIAAEGRPEIWRFLLMLAAMFGGQVAIGAHNEWRDREHDAKHQPEKPIPSGLVDPHRVRPIIAGGLAMGIGAGVALGFWPLILFLVGAGSGFVYNLWLKRTPLSGVPYLVGLPLLPIWATMVMDRFEPQLLWLYPLGGAYVVAVHLAQSLSDIEGDTAAGTRGLAVVLGRQQSRQVIWGIAAVTVFAMPLGQALLGGRVLYALLGAAGAAILFATAAAVQARSASKLDDMLMEILAAGAVMLAIGWILAATT